MKPTVIIVPAAKGNADFAFYEDLQNRLLENGFEVFRLGVENPIKYGSWSSEFDSLKDKFGSETFVVAHSNGGMAVLRYISENDLKIKSLHLVATAFEVEKISVEDSEFIRNQVADLQQNIDYDLVDKNCEFIDLHYSTDDDTVEYSEWQKYRERLPKSILNKYQDKGHFRDTQFLELAERVINQEQNSWTIIEGVRYRIKLEEDENLPLVLPRVEDYQPNSDGRSPLAKTDWIKLEDKNGNSVGIRESDVMPNWAGSSWYYLRYTDPKNSEELASQENLRYWLPVDHYFGGNEHTTLHLLYSRFWHRFLYDQGHVPTPEPYIKRTNGGILLGPDGSKMSKSKGNVINPKEILAEMGADALRLYVAFIGPYDATVVWQEGGLKACKKLVDSIFRLQERVNTWEVEDFQTGSVEVESRIKEIEEMARVEGAQLVADALVVNSEGKVFLQKRSKTRKFLPDCWDMPGGHQEAGESFEQVLNRELMEETGWLLKKIKKVYEPRRAVFDGGKKKMFVSCLVEVDGDLDNPQIETDKNSTYDWFDYNNLDLLKESVERGAYNLNFIKMALVDTQPLENTIAFLQKIAIDKGLKLNIQALIKDDSRGLFAQHRAKDRLAFPDMWEASVYGKVEDGEAVMETLKREIKEETGWDLESVDKYIGSLYWAYDGKIDTLKTDQKKVTFSFLVRVNGDLDNPSVETNKVSEWKWLKKEDINLFEGNYKLGDFNTGNTARHVFDLDGYKPHKELRSAYHKFVKKVTDLILEMKNNVAVAEIMTFVNLLKEYDQIPKDIWLGFLQVVAPFAPHTAEELWYETKDLDKKDATKSIHLTSWPQYDSSLCVEDEVTIVVQINGKVRAEFQIAKDSSDQVVLDLAKEKAAKYLDGKTIKFSKVIPNKMVTLAVG